jgi:large repetitive protein
MPARFGAAGTIVAGIPARAGTFPFTVTGTDDLGEPLKQAYSIAVAPPLPLAIENPSTLPAGQMGASYFPVTFFTIHGAPATITWSLAAGHLPPGLALSSPNAPDIIHNQLSGTPTKAGTFTFTMKVTDGIGRHATKKFSLTIQP